MVRFRLSLVLISEINITCTDYRHEIYSAKHGALLTGIGTRPIPECVLGGMGALQYVRFLY